jgi:hypothetical protein
MCLSCGCGEPHESHGNADNITYEDLEKAAMSEGITVEQAADNIKAGLSNV